MQKPETVEVDGRRIRGQTNRRKIVDAMIALVSEGVLTPSAQEVAARANVGLRTVFRHFDDMDSLYSEMSAQISKRVLPAITAAFVATDWRGRIEELIERRSEAFEMMLPFKSAADVIRHKSKFLTEGHEELVKFSRARVIEALPGEMRKRRGLVEALDLLLSFEAWRRLRRDQKLSAAQAKQAVATAVGAVLKINVS
ncbi:MAG: TetR family transcriptional regulator [Alphaproteobacteria bacterium]|nr:TetR family transcriptional regulator [Alphaproteobacteria bacterium]